MEPVTIRIAFLLAVMLAMAGPASAVVGDLNRDGVVDLEDFFVFADNFGRRGQPETFPALPGSSFLCACPTVDCTSTGPLVDDGSVIPDLLSVRFTTGEGPHNWDADAEGEGMLVRWYLTDTELNSIGRTPETVVHKLTISYWVADRLSGAKKTVEPFWVQEFETLASTRTLRVPFEEYASLVPEEYITGYEHIGLYVWAVAELVLIQADGSRFEARASAVTMWLNTW